MPKVKQPAYPSIEAAMRWAENTGGKYCPFCERVLYPVRGVTINGDGVIVHDPVPHDEDYNGGTVQ